MSDQRNGSPRRTSPIKAVYAIAQQLCVDAIGIQNLNRNKASRVVPRSIDRSASALPDQGVNPVSRYVWETHGKWGEIDFLGVDPGPSGVSFPESGLLTPT